MTKENEEIEIPNFKPGDRVYMFGFNGIDVGKFGTTDFKAKENKFGVVCVRIVQKVTVEHANSKTAETFFTISMLNDKGEDAIDPKTNQPMQFNVAQDELFKDLILLEEMIEEKVKLATKNSAVLLTNSIVDAKTAYRKSSPIAS